MIIFISDLSCVGTISSMNSDTAANKLQIELEKKAVNCYSIAIV